MDRIVFKRKRQRIGVEAGRAEEEAGAYEGPDLISRLPDCVLGAIVTLLGTAQGARTAAISRRWRDVWCSAPLNLDLLEFAYFSHERIDAISKILAAHRGPVRRLAIRSLDLHSNFSLFDTWFRLPLLDALQELIFHPFFLPNPSPPMPASALRFAALRVLDIKNCSFPAAAGCAFPCLSHLSLRRVGITEEILHHIISSSPRIEAMVLDTNFGHRRLCLSLPRLRYLAVSDQDHNKREDELDNLVVEDATNLEQLLLHDSGDDGPCVRITGATKLKMLGYIGPAFPIIELGTTIFKDMVAVSLAEQFSTVRILALEMPEPPELKILVGYLRCFPCLEMLKIKLSASWNNFFGKRWTGSSLKGDVPCDPCAPLECLDRNLKTIVLRLYSGQKSHANFAKFFVERARVLKVMKFCVTVEVTPTPTWLEDQCRLLNVENRASKCARFPFVLERDMPYQFWMDVGFSRDDDPFVESTEL